MRIFMGFRQLKPGEITELENNLCMSDNWANVSVNENFNPSKIKNTRFSGMITIGNLSKDIEILEGIVKPSGISNSYIQNCSIGDNVYINEVKNLANYNIKNDVIIENVGLLAVTGETSFGNGVEIEILNEGGGRELPIYDKLSSQIAYMLVNYRHDSIFIGELKKLIKEYTDNKKSNIGTIGQKTKILNCIVLKNLNIGEYAELDSVARLENGTIVSSEEAPSSFGINVDAENFIALEGCKVNGGVVIDNCFIGQAVKIGKQYSAENSALFANSEFFHGEACSIFAGPYTVTHHKSSLLIAGMFSFYNAGSGTNQSNHMYKLGPLHQGILERGSKTGSFSYMLWPCRTGAFTAVLGKHYNHFDTTSFPFSYIDEVGGKSVLTPAMNLLTVGTTRDSGKWPNRDKRKAKIKRDLINFELYSPYTIGKMLEGSNILTELYEGASKKLEYVKHRGVYIKRLMLKMCKKYYKLGLDVYIGQELSKKIKSLETSSFSDFKKQLFAETVSTSEKWCDVSGMITPVNEINKIIEMVKSGELSCINCFEDKLRDLFNSYEEYAWKWTAGLILQTLEKTSQNIEKDDLIKLLENWDKSNSKLNNMILKDAEKEFDENSRMGFGIDGTPQEKEEDFKNVRGEYSNDKFVLGLEKEKEKVSIKVKELVKIIMMSL